MLQTGISERKELPSKYAVAMKKPEEPDEMAAMRAELERAKQELEGLKRNAT